MRALRKSPGLGGVVLRGKHSRDSIAEHVSFNTRGGLLPTPRRRPSLASLGDGRHPIRHTVERGRIAAAPNVQSQLLERVRQDQSQEPHFVPVLRVGWFDEANQNTERDEACSGSRLMRFSP